MQSAKLTKLDLTKTSLIKELSKLDEQLIQKLINEKYYTEAKLELHHELACIVVEELVLKGFIDCDNP